MERHITALQMSDLFFNFCTSLFNVRSFAEEFADFFTHQDEADREKFIEDLIKDFERRA